MVKVLIVCNYTQKKLSRTFKELSIGIKTHKIRKKLTKLFAVFRRPLERFKSTVIGASFHANFWLSATPYRI